MTFAQKINIIPEFYMIFARKVPEFDIIINNCPRNIFRIFFFWGGGGHVPALPPRLLHLCLFSSKQFIAENPAGRRRNTASFDTYRISFLYLLCCSVVINRRLLSASDVWLCPGRLLKDWWSFVGWELFTMLIFVETMDYYIVIRSVHYAVLSPRVSVNFFADHWMMFFMLLFNK